MTRLILALAVIIMMACGSSKNKASADQTQIFLVRHAEKADDGTRNPPLTQLGKDRASSLSKLLMREDINLVYSTDYLRTKHTAQPHAAALGLSVQLYDPRKLPEFANQLSNLKGQNILVVGHSNSTPSLANAILETETYKQFDESEYSNLIVITINGDQKATEMRSF